MTEENIQFRKSTTAVSTSIDGEEILLDSDNGIYFSLNEVASDIWRLLEQPKSMHELIDWVCSNYEVDRLECTSSIELLISEMLERQLIVGVAQV